MVQALCFLGGICLSLFCATVAKYLVQGVISSVMEAESPRSEANLGSGEGLWLSQQTDGIMQQEHMPAW